jgi:hypothetical protein
MLTASTDGLLQEWMVVLRVVASPSKFNGNKTNGPGELRPAAGFTGTF